MSSPSTPAQPTSNMEKTCPNAPARPARVSIMSSRPPTPTPVNRPSIRRALFDDSVRAREDEEWRKEVESLKECIDKFQKRSYIMMETMSIMTRKFDEYDALLGELGFRYSPDRISCSLSPEPRPKRRRTVSPSPE